MWQIQNILYFIFNNILGKLNHLFPVEFSAENCFRELSELLSKGVWFWDNKRKWKYFSYLYDICSAAPYSQNIF